MIVRLHLTIVFIAIKLFGLMIQMIDLIPNYICKRSPPIGDFLKNEDIKSTLYIVRNIAETF